jgi:hypothetical protein
MAESFLEEQIRRIRELSARISESQTRRAELTRLLEERRSHYGPLEGVRDLSPYGDRGHGTSSAAREPVHARKPRRRRRRR